MRLLCELVLTCAQPDAPTTRLFSRAAANSAGCCAQRHRSFLRVCRAWIHRRAGSGTANHGVREREKSAEMSCFGWWLRSPCLSLSIRDEHNVFHHTGVCVRVGLYSCRTTHCLSPLPCGGGGGGGEIQCCHGCIAPLFSFSGHQRHTTTPRVPSNHAKVLPLHYTGPESRVTSPASWEERRHSVLWSLPCPPRSLFASTPFWSAL